MQYAMRRGERRLSEEDAWNIIRRGEWGVLSVVSPDGEPYGVPLNYVLRDGSLYFHCAPEGRKLDCLGYRGRSSFVVVDFAQVSSAHLTSFFASAMCFGCTQDASEEERLPALEDLAQKYSPGWHSSLEQCAQRTQVLRFDIERISGKCNPPR